MSFADDFLHRSKTKTGLCIGIDPMPAVLKQWGLEDSVSGLSIFCNRVLDAIGDRVSVIKPQIAFFERFGTAGLVELKALTKRIKEQGALALLDAKRGDIGTTLDAYSQAYLGSDSPFNADAITVAPYLGVGALQPIFSRAQETGTGVFVVVRSSNPEGRILQDAKIFDGRAIADYVADEITLFNRSTGPEIGPIGAVVGATITQEEAAILERLENSLILAPGVGAQGATILSARERFGSHISRVLISVSRGVLQQGPDLIKVSDSIERYQEQLIR